MPCCWHKLGPKTLLHWKSSFQSITKLGKPWLLVTVLAPALQRTSLPAPVCLLEYQLSGVFGYAGSQSSGECTLTTVNPCRQVCWLNDIKPRVWHINFQRHREYQNKTLTYFFQFLLLKMAFSSWNWQVTRHFSQLPHNGFLTSTEYAVSLGLHTLFLCYLIIARLIRKKRLLRFKIDVIPFVYC